MDPLSITVGVATLLHLAATLALTLKKVRSNLRSASTELHSIDKELQSFTIVLNRLGHHRESINSTNGKEGDDDELLKALQACKETLCEIEARITSAAKVPTSRRSFKNIRQSLSWPSLRKEMQLLLARLEHDKSTLLMSLHLESLDLENAALNIAIKTDDSIRDLVQEVQQLKAFKQGREPAPVPICAEMNPAIREGSAEPSPTFGEIQSWRMDGEGIHFDHENLALRGHLEPNMDFKPSCSEDTSAFLLESEETPIGDRSFSASFSEKVISEYNLDFKGQNIGAISGRHSRAVDIETPHRSFTSWLSTCQDSNE